MPFISAIRYDAKTLENSADIKYTFLKIGVCNSAST